MEAITKVTFVDTYGKEHLFGYYTDQKKMKEDIHIYKCGTAEDLEFTFNSYNLNKNLLV